MKSSPLLPRRIAYFLELYKALNYANASRAIPITTQGLKKAIASLEADLKVPLFELSETGALAPTAYAVELERIAARWAHDAAGIDELFSQMKLRGRKQVVLHAAIGSLHVLGGDFVARFERANPSLSLELVELPDESVDNLLTDGDIDYAIAAEPYCEGFSVARFDPVESCALVNREHPLAFKKELSMEDFDDLDVMLPNPRLKTFDRFEKAFEESGTRPRSVSFCSDMMAPFLFASANKGVGIIVRQVADELGNIDNLVSLPIKGEFGYSFGLAVRKGYAFDSDERALLDFIVANSGYSCSLSR